MTKDVDKAKQMLAQDKEERKQRYHAGLKQLAQETGFDVAPCVQLPGGELVRLESFLKAVGIEATPCIKVVET